MRTIQISDQAYQALVQRFGDVGAYMEKLAAESAEAGEVLAVQEGIEAYRAGDFRALEDFGAELRARFGIQTPDV